MTLGAAPFLGVLTAVVGALFLAVGAQLQHRGLTLARAGDPEAERGVLGAGQLWRLIRTPLWLAGILSTGLAMALNLVSLRLAPLIVVQPLGVAALVATALLNAAVYRYSLSWASGGAMLMCVAGIGAFVTVGALTARNSVVSDGDLGQILTALAVVVVLIAIGLAGLRRRFPATVNVLAAGALSGFVVTLAKTVVTRVAVGNFGILTILGAVTLVLVAVSAQYFVQSAYASGPVDLIVAGLTILDPLIAVTLGVLILGEAAATPLWAVAAYCASGAVAIAGVILLARHHPQAEIHAEVEVPARAT